MVCPTRTTKSYGDNKTVNVLYALLFSISPIDKRKHVLTTITKQAGFVSFCAIPVTCFLVQQETMNRYWPMLYCIWGNTNAQARPKQKLREVMCAG